MRRSLPALAVGTLLTALLVWTAPAYSQAHKSGTSGQTHHSTAKSGTSKAPAKTSAKHPATKSTSAKSSASHSGTSKTATTPRVRSEAAKHEFWKHSGYPKGRPGYVVDHIIPLACGGADAPSNMQWQTVEAAKAKDKVERVGCGR